MITVRQLERLWLAKDYGRMASLLLEMRAESSVRLRMELSRAVPVAALAVVRLDELAQSHQPFASRMIRVILAAQEADGGWGDPLVTALCVRALCCSRGDGLAIDRGIGYLAELQKADGAWPRVPLRRMPADAFVSAFVLHQLIDESRFCDAVDVDAAVAWFDAHDAELDVETERLWKGIAVRLRSERAAGEEPALAWS